jgi:hypothetical protein
VGIAAILAWAILLVMPVPQACAEQPSALVIGETVSTGNIIEIRPSETPEKSGAILLKTLNELIKPTRERPFLLRISPGVYFLGKESLVLKPFLTIEGAGSITIIRGSVSAEERGLVIGSDNAVLRSISIENRAEGPAIVGIMNRGVSPVLTDVEIFTAGSGECAYGIWNYSSGASIKGSKVTVEGARFNHGIFNQNSSPTIRSSEVKASGGEESFGVLNLYSDPVISEVSVEAEGASTFNVAIWNVSSQSEITDVVASSRGGDQNVAIYNVSSDAFFDRISALASGRAGTSYGIRNLGSSPKLLNSVVRTSGAGYGMHNISSSPHIINVLLSALGEGEAFGLFNSGQGNRVKADRSTISGTTLSVFSDRGSVVSLGGCALEGPIGGEGSFDCAFSSVAERKALNASCK